MADEQPSFASDHRGPHVILDQVVINFETAITQVTHQGRIVIEEIVHRLAQGALGQEWSSSPQLQSAPFHRLPKRRPFLPAHCPAFLWAGASDLIFNPVKLPDLGYEPNGLGTRL